LLPFVKIATNLGHTSVLVERFDLKPKEAPDNPPKKPLDNPPKEKTDTTVLEVFHCR
jgi:hypothetical protein